MTRTRVPATPDGSPPCSWPGWFSAPGVAVPVAGTAAEPGLDRRTAARDAAAGVTFALRRRLRVFPLRCRWCGTAPAARCDAGLRRRRHRTLRSRCLSGRRLQGRAAGRVALVRRAQPLGGARPVTAAGECTAPGGDSPAARASRVRKAQLTGEGQQHHLARDAPLRHRFHRRAPVPRGRPAHRAPCRDAACPRPPGPGSARWRPAASRWSRRPAPRR